METTATYDEAPWLRHYAPGMSADRIVSPYRSLAELVSHTAERFGSQTAFTTCMPNGMNGSLTFDETEEMSDAFAVYLREHLQVLPGTRVAVQMPNCLTYPVVAMGVFKAGCVLVNVNPMYTETEMEHQFNDSGAAVLVIMDMFMDKLEAVLPKTTVRHVVTTSVAQWFPPTVGRIMHLILKYWNKAIPEHNVNSKHIDHALQRGRDLKAENGIDVEDYWSGLRPEHTALLQYTGGTTGVSKGAELTHGNLLANIQQIDVVAGDHIEEGKECVVTALPLYHIFAFSVNLLAFYKTGAHNILVPSPRPIQNIQRAIENYPVSWISGVNTLYNAILNEEWFTLYPPKTMKAALAGGTALHKSVAQKWTRIVGSPIAEGYGLTETSPVLCFNPLDQPKSDSIGIPVPGTEIAIVDDDGNPVPAGEPGEIIARGPQVMQGYWNRPDETAKSMKDGWFYTGDVAYMDKDAYFHIVDRKKDMILVSGFNVYPNEVEDCIAMIDEVQESAVIGLPDAKSGEAVAAYVVLREDGPTTDDIRRHCKKHLTSYKVPKTVEFREDLPKTPVGKVLRKELRAEVTGSTQPQRDQEQSSGSTSGATGEKRRETETA